MPIQYYYYFLFGAWLIVVFLHKAQLLFMVYLFNK